MENKILDETLNILDQQGAAAAYSFLLQGKSQLHDASSQLYNFLYCLAALSERPDEALGWLEEAVLVKGYWYRPSVFDDDDLVSICDDARFLHCRGVSEQRYREAEAQSDTLCTWDGSKSRAILLALHGNQQNMMMCRPQWAYFEKLGVQLECVQSKTLDSYQLYRWEDEAASQLAGVIDDIPWASYEKHYLGGFSAGCNEILKALVEADFPCQGIILQSPWIPYIHDHLAAVVDALRRRQAWVLIICGLEDDDCLSDAQQFAQSLAAHDIQIRAAWVKGLGHAFPDEFERMIDDMKQQFSLEL